MTFFQDMKKISAELIQKGFQVYLPEEQESEISRELLGTDDFSKEKGAYIEAHLLKIQKSDKLLIVNFPKNNINGYIGPNSLIELAFGYALRKELYILNELSEQPCKPEVISMGASILNGNAANV